MNEASLPLTVAGAAPAPQVRSNDRSSLPGFPFHPSRRTWMETSISAKSPERRHDVNYAKWSYSHQTHKPDGGIPQRDATETHTMSLAILDQISLCGGGTNEDRIGTSGEFAWVIDGATDVLDEPLTPAPTDADWLAGTLDAALHVYGAHPTCSFADLPGHLTDVAAQSFAAVARRQPEARHEHPSASALVVRHAAGILSYWAVSDCTLIVAPPGEDLITLSGVAREEAGDSRLRHAVRQQQAETQIQAAAERDPPELLDQMRPLLQDMRARMNREDGYGVLSITPTPEAFIRSGFITAPAGTELLLASDGFMRLVDVFQRHDAQSLLSAAREHGLKRLAEELRAMETADRTGSAHPRVKSTDDASALLLRIAD